MIGAEYRQRPRDRLERRKVRGPELFGIARQVNKEESVVFAGLLRAIPRISGHEIDKSKVKESPSLKLINRGLVSSALERSSKKRIEPKDLRRWEGEILDSVNGRGSYSLEIDAEDFIPEVIKLRGRSIGSLVVRSESSHYQQLVDANEIALEGLRHANRADSDDRRGILRPRIDLFKHTDRNVVEQTMERFSHLLIDKTATLTLEPARGYRPSS